MYEGASVRRDLRGAASGNGRDGLTTVIPSGCHGKAIRKIEGTDFSLTGILFVHIFIVRSHRIALRFHQR